MSEWLASEYAKATEWNLATLEEMSLIKGTSTSRIRRQRSICASMLDVCNGLADVDWTKTLRTSQLLSSMRQGATAAHVLNKEIAALRDGWTS